MPSFIVGQWQTYGTPYLNSVWHAANPPVDPYKTFADGTVATAGQDLRQAMQGVNGVNGRADWIFTQCGAYDSDRDRFVVTCCSGHDGGGSNEINEFICATGLWEHRTDPTVELYVRRPNSWPATIGYGPSGGADGYNLEAPEGVRDVNNRYPANVLPSTGSGQKVYPIGRQHYGCITYMPAPYNKLWQCGGVAMWGSLHNASYPYTYDVLAKQWQMQDAETGYWPRGTGFPGGACWDSTYGRVLFYDFNALWEYDPSKPAGSRITRIWWSGGYYDANDETTALWNPKLKRLYLFGGRTETGYGPRYFDFAPGRYNGANPVAFPWSFGSYPGAQGLQGQAVLYDSLRDRFVYAPTDGTRTLIAIDPVSGATTDLTPTTGTTPPALRLLFPESGNNSQCFGRFFYSKGQDAYVFLINPEDASAFVYKPASLTTPRLAFTDLTQGKRTGNIDTSKGQTANVHGALVTVWGTNLGSTQGTSTITLGGVAPPVIYYWGNATPPWGGPATLYNQYQKLQCIIFQVASTTPTGAQNIVVTVNGQASNGLPFTVTTTGNIYFAGAAGLSAPSGGFATQFTDIQTMLNAMDRLDIGYICDGLNNTFGVQLPTPNTRGDHGVTTDPFAIVAYPGASVQLGDATHTGLQISFSSTGYGVTYAKLKVYGDQNSYAVAPSDNSRVVGLWVSAPNLNSGSGAAAIGIDGSRGGFNVAILGNEVTNVGAPQAAGAGNTLDHVIYLAARRDPPVPTSLESNREVGWNYLHDNKALRGINLFNGSGTNSNPMSDHIVHDNVIVNQDGDGILFGRGVVGNNSAYNNLLINVGLNTGGQWSSSAGLVGIDFQMSEANGTGFSVPHAPTVVTASNNTLLNCGAATGGSGSLIGAFMMSHTVGVARLFNNLVYQQAVSFSYLTSSGPSPNNPGAPDATKWSNNLWFGAGAAPTWDTNPLNVNPALVSATSPYDLHLQSSSQCIGRGIALTGTGLLDLDGDAHPATAWSIGADEPSGAGGGGSIGTNVSLTPATLVAI